MKQGAQWRADVTDFAVIARHATRLWLCLDIDGEERRIPMARAGDWHRVAVPGLLPGQRYAFRAEGPWQPEAGHRYDPAKLLVDPYASRIDKPFVQDPRLATFGADTAGLVPWAVIEPPLPEVAAAAARFQPGGLIYEINVRAFTMRHPEVPPAMRGTLAALGHPAVIDHLRRMGVDAVELMPITAWIDERHLPPLGLNNGWGYNPVVPMALDPRLAPHGMADLRTAVSALHQAGIGVMLDLVLNHTGESDVHGPTLSLRGLDHRLYYSHAPDGQLINDTGTGNTLDFGQAAVRDIALDTLRHFVCHAGVDGFRFDLAPIMARSPGFDRDAPIFAAIADDPWLADRVMIAEPWDIGPGGYQLGRFPDHWLEWNDRYRDDMRRCWRGDGGLIGSLVTRIAGSSDIFGGALYSRSVNFLAAHDGFTLADLVSHEQRHNHANGEDNRDGHGENFSWNNGVEGLTDDPVIVARRKADLRALLALLCVSKGTIMVTAGDECGRSQQGNNNAYCQDNGLTWFDWAGRDRDLEAWFGQLMALRKASPILSDPGFFRPDQVCWRRPDGAPFGPADWHDPAPCALMADFGDMLLLINRRDAALDFILPPGNWVDAMDSRACSAVDGVTARSVRLLSRKETC